VHPKKIKIMGSDFIIGYGKRFFDKGNGIYFAKTAGIHQLFCPMLFYPMLF